MSHNGVTVFQNGIASFERQINVIPGATPTRISLPLKTQDIGDFLTSVKVAGDVRWAELPTYSPVRQKPALTINPAAVTKSLFNALSGASIAVQAHHGDFKGEVLGIDTEITTSAAGVQSEDNFLTLMGDDGTLRRLSLRYDIKGYVFTDNAVQSEVRKALAYNFEQTKPGNTFVNMGLTSLKPTEAILKYSIPTAAWKFTYRLRNVNEKWFLDGLAIVDNPTDEDWNNYIVTVATGSPVTFESDLASIRLPKRERVNFVSDNATGSVKTQSSLECVTGDANYAALAHYGADSSPKGGRRVQPSAACGSPPAAPMLAQADPASFDAAAVEEIGELSVFTSSVPVSIPARKSALIPLFSNLMGKASTVLYYQDGMKRNPMRSVKIVNTNDFTLGYGSLEVEEKGTHAGTAELAMTKKGNTAFVSYIPESGVTVHSMRGKEKITTTQLKLFGGTLVSQKKWSVQTTYEIRNQGSDINLLIVDYSAAANSKVSVKGAEVLETLGDGTVRIAYTLNKETTSFEVTEFRLDSSSIKADGIIDWFVQNPKCQLLSDPAMKNFVGMMGQLQTMRDKIQDHKNRLATLNNTQDRIRKNLTVMADNSELKTQLMTSEKEIGEIDILLPKLELTKNEFVRQMRAEAEKLTASWEV